MSTSSPALINMSDYWSFPPSAQRATEALVDAAGFDHTRCFRVVVGLRSVWFWFYDDPTQLDGDDLAYHVERVAR